MLLAQRQNIVSRRRSEIRDIDMRHARVLAFRLAHRPAHHLDTIKALLMCEAEHFLKLQVGQNRGHEAQLHGITLRNLESRQCGRASR